MILKKSLTLLTIVCLWGISTLRAQEKLWQIDLHKKMHTVSWIEQTNEGFILASGASGLMSLNNKTGETVWHNPEVDGAIKSSLIQIDGLPIFYCETATGGILVNSSNGNILFDARKEKVKIHNYTILLDRSMILFEVTKGKSIALMSFDLKKLQKQWVTPVGTAPKLISLSLSKFVDKGPFFTKENKILVAVNEKISAIDFETGKLDWQFEGKRKIKSLIYSGINDCVYIGVRKEKKLTILNPKSGADITPGKFKLKGELLDVIAQDENNIILVDSYGFNLIDPKTNGFKWKKKAQQFGISEVFPYENGYIGVTRGEKDGLIAFYDANGKNVWKTKVNGCPYFVSPSSKGVMYISTERANILEPQKGKDVWKRDVKFNAIPAVTFDPKENKVMLFENKKGYKFDLDKGDIQQFADGIKLEKVSKSTPLVAEYVENKGYLLSTAQHMSLLSPSGKLVYTHYHKPATSIKGLVRVAQMGLYIAGVDFDLEGAVANINQLKKYASFIPGTGDDNGDAQTETSVVGGLYAGSVDGEMVAICEISQERHYNSKHTKDAQYIVTAVSGDSGKQHFIYKVDKETGENKAKIQLKDKTPSYVVDSIDDVVVVNEKAHIITAYKL